MLTMLLDDLKQKQQGINTHIDNQAFSDARELVHQLHGSSCYCGTPLLKESSGKLEKILAASATEEIGDALTELNFAMDQLMEWQKNHDITALFSTD
jgi:two-component system sensor histidine kinase BarA